MKNDVLELAAAAIESSSCDKVNTLTTVAERLAILAKSKDYIFGALLVVAAHLKEEKDYSGALYAYYHAVCSAPHDDVYIKSAAVSYWYRCVTLADKASANRAIMYAFHHPKRAQALQGLVDVFRGEMGEDAWNSCRDEATKTKNILKKARQSTLEADSASEEKSCAFMWCKSLLRAEKTNPRLVLPHAYFTVLAAHKKRSENDEAASNPTFLEKIARAFFLDRLACALYKNRQVQDWFPKNRQGDQEKAVKWIDEIRQWLSTNGIIGIEYPLCVYLACIDILSKNGRSDDSKKLLQEAHLLIKDRASRIDDPELRESY
ncbi:MAG: hypothetical protein HGA90_00600, partial [Alphaproteobacteria bacterium]|nr:hypothetical protein [Alphaproteobacteria bacterium]